MSGNSTRDAPGMPAGIEATTGQPSIAIIGGTGALGSALAARWAGAGYRVIIGSRSVEKAIATAAAIDARIAATAAGSHDSAPTLTSGLDHLSAAGAADIIVISVPYASHAATLDEIAAAADGKIVVDTVVPLQPPKVSVVHLPEHGSAAQAAQQRLGPGVRVVAAFHNVSAGKIAAGGPIDCDVLVFGDDRAARDIVGSLVTAAGARPVDGGPIANSVAAEALTAVLIGINRRYKTSGAGIRIMGIPGDADAR